MATGRSRSVRTRNAVRSTVEHRPSAGPRRRARADAPRQAERARPAPARRGATPGSRRTRPSAAPGDRARAGGVPAPGAQVRAPRRARPAAAIAPARAGCPRAARREPLAAELDAGAGQHPGAEAAGAGCDLLDQPRLPDAGLAAHEHDRRLARSLTFARGNERQFELSAPPDEHGADQHRHPARGCQP